MQALSVNRCFNHATREPVARCTACRNFFCRECISEHDERILCAACLVKLGQKAAGKKARFIPVVRVAQLALSVIVAWFFFYFVGITLLRIPSSFHENTFWKAPPDDEE